jgi:hypothetical protein
LKTGCLHVADDFGNVFLYTSLPGGIHAESRDILRALRIF